MVDGRGLTSNEKVTESEELAGPDVRQSGSGSGLPPTSLFDLGEIEVHLDRPAETLWAFYTPTAKPNYSFAVLKDTTAWQEESKRLFGNGDAGLKYMVLGSRFPGFFNVGGDLEKFAEWITACNRAMLREYGRLCVETVERSWRNNDMPVINIGLAQGDALGGGFEALLTFDVLVAERGVKFGFPEAMFGLFPGMGAYSLLARKLNHSVAERMLREGTSMTAEQLHEMGVVHVLAEPGEGEQAVRDYIAANRRKHAGQLELYRSGRKVMPMRLDELYDIVEGWVDAAMQLTEKELRIMKRLSSAQVRLKA